MYRTERFELQRYSDDLNLVEQLVAGQRSAWSVFVQKHLSLVTARVRKTLFQFGYRGHSEIDDVVAEVFAALLAQDMAVLRSYRGESTLATWLSVISHRICLRQSQRLARYAALVHVNDATVLNSQSPQKRNELDRLIQTESAERLRETIRQLKPTDQQILELYYHEQLEYSEIGEKMGISINTVGPKLHRATARLKRLMGQDP
jgi:RNA polymerase sigma-70 factor, ECF subfamily